MRFTIHKTTQSQRCRRKRGFTLLETMLSIALLLVLTLIIYQGFVYTMQLSTNSALYSKSGTVAAGNVYSQMATTVVSSTTVPSGAIHLQFSASSYKNLGVVGFVSAPSTSTNYGDASYRESTNLNSTNRHGFIYCGKALT
jgi:prepilin-type N-terminal cleavage/methylation domain-containing protein